MLDEENGSQEYIKVIQYIYRLIDAGTLEVGSKLPTERSIAGQLGIGRNSTREALSILHGMGIIERRQGSGNYVSGDAGRSIGQIILMMVALKRISHAEICEFRRSMEKTVCSTIVKKGLSGERRLILKDCLEKLEDEEAELLRCSVSERNACLAGLAAADDDFHNELVKAADNGLMAVIMDAVTQVYKDSIERVIYNADEELRAELMECHRNIYDGMISGDYEAVEKAIDRHYDIIIIK